MISDAVATQMGYAVQSQLRLLDRAMVPGSKWPMGIYTFDLDPGAISPSPHPDPNEEVIWNARMRFRARQALATQKNEKSQMKMDEFIAGMEDAKAMRACYTEAFHRYYAMGFQNYVAGEWEVATRLFGETLGMIQGVSHDKDGPSSALLKFMASYDNVAPANWPGYRELKAADIS